MKIVVTDCGFLWNQNALVLEQSAKEVLLISLEGRENLSDKYKCFISPYKNIGGLGMDSGKAQKSRKYQTLYSVADKLLEEFEQEEDVLFLTDNEPQTLYPFTVLKKYSKNIRIHLWAMIPFKFEASRRQKEFKNLMSDLSYIQSIIFFDANKILKEADKKITIPELLEQIKNLFYQYLSVVKSQIPNQEKNKKYYFDFSKNTYVEFSTISKAKQDDFFQESILNEKNENTYDIVLSDMTEKENNAKKYIEQLVPRLDGKEVCNLLRKMRIELAEANGIAFESPECPFTGLCAGTCEKCDEEIVYLNRELQKIPQEKRIYPEKNIGKIKLPQKEQRTMQKKCKIMGMMSYHHKERADKLMRVATLNPQALEKEKPKDVPQLKIPDFLRRKDNGECNGNLKTENGD